MRKILIAACVFTVGLDLEAGATSLALRGGLNLANMMTDPPPPADINTGYRRGLMLGTQIEIPVNPVIGFVFSGQYENKGMTWTESDPFSGVSPTVTLKVNYLVFPAFFSFGNAVYSPFQPRFFMHVGLEPSFKLSSSYEVEGRSSDARNLTDFDLSAAAEMGGDFPISANGIALVFGGGYAYGLINLDDSPSTGTLHNYCLRLYGGVKFDLRPDPTTRRLGTEGFQAPR